MIFNPLVQIPSTATGHQTAGDSTSLGLGLGLYIAQEIVTRHGGTIVAESDEDGTVFSTQLPKASTAQAAEVADRSPA